MERVLVADDNESARELLTCVLESRGYSVITACDGFQALQELKYSSPDLLLLDIEMPGMNGCEVCALVKSQSATRDIPVVLVSGLADTAERALTSGADGFVLKPFGLDALITEVRKHLPAQTSEKAGAVQVGQGSWLSAFECARLCAEGT
jgi:CheY-like chemotaxis protein